MDRKGKVNNKIYDIITHDEFVANPALYVDAPMTAIHENGMFYPIRKNNTLPGFFVKNQVFGVFINPAEEDINMYSDDTLIDFGSAKSMQDIINKKAEFKNMEREILCDPDNVFRPVIKETDSPEMKIFKEAVCNKKIDINKYEDRIGSTFANDKRLFSKGTMTLAKLVNMARAFDMKATLTLEDTSDTVPNPMGVRLSIDLTGGDGFNDE